MSSRKNCVIRRNNSIWDLIHQQERQMIKRWRNRRQDRLSYCEFFALPFSIETVKSFAQHINIVVIVHVIVTTLAVFLFQR